MFVEYKFCVLLLKSLASVLFCGAEKVRREMDDEYAKLIRRMNPPRYVAQPVVLCYEALFFYRGFLVF